MSKVKRQKTCPYAKIIEVNRYPTAGKTLADAIHEGILLVENGLLYIGNGKGGQKLYTGILEDRAVIKGVIIAESTGKPGDYKSYARMIKEFDEEVVERKAKQLEDGLGVKVVVVPYKH